MVSDFYTQQDVLHSEFNAEVHKKTFTHYLEVVIDELGNIEYAVPSHQEKMLELACHKKGLSRDEMYQACPREYWFDVLMWLHLQSGAIAVWEDHYVGDANENQVRALDMLKRHQLYTGI